MANIFISYIHEEEDKAEALSWLLRDMLEVKAFLSSDSSQLPGGEEWLERIRSEIQGCQVMLSLLTQQSVKRPWINFEAGAAWACRKPVIPCYYGGIKKEALQQPFESFQAFGMPDDHYKLVISVHTHLKLEKLLPPPVLRHDERTKAFKKAFLPGNKFLVPPPFSPPSRVSDAG